MRTLLTADQTLSLAQAIVDLNAELYENATEEQRQILRENDRAVLAATHACVEMIRTFDL